MLRPPGHCPAGKGQSNQIGHIRGLRGLEDLSVITDTQNLCYPLPHRHCSPQVVTGRQADSLFLVFEYCEHDLGRLIDSLPVGGSQAFTVSEVKCLVRAFYNIL